MQSKQKMSRIRIYQSESSLLVTLKCLMLCTVVLWVGVYGQKTPIDLGCTFTDNEHVYNVHLASGDRNLPCPDSEAVKEHLKVTVLSCSCKEVI